MSNAFLPATVGVSLAATPTAMLRILATSTPSL